MKGKLQLALLLLTAAWASGAPTFLKGDKDGFNLGLHGGDAFDWTKIAPQAGDDGTDTWLIGPKTWQLSLDGLDGLPLEAQLGIFHGGSGLGGPAEVLINGISVGYLTDTDNRVDLPGNLAYYDLLDITPVADQLSGSVLLTVNTAANDGWAVDYIELTTGGEFVGAVVPAPGAVLLGSGGLLITGWLRRRKSL